jgi:hypothetical protein
MRKILRPRTTRYVGMERGCVKGSFVIFSHIQIFTDFNGKPEGNKPFGRCMRKWEANIKMDIQYIQWGYLSGLELGHVAGSREYGNGHDGSIKCW